MSEAIKPIDIPTADQGSLIMYSTRNHPTFKSYPRFTSQTELTLSGHYEDDVVEINVVNNEFICVTKAFAQMSQGSITVHATTAGDDNFDGAEIDFGFTVLVHGSDRATLASFHSFDYLEDVDATITPSMFSGAYVGCEIINCEHDAALDGFYVKDYLGKSSGLQVVPNYSDNWLLSVQLIGKCTRPGMYGFFLKAQSAYSTPGQKDFVDGSDFVPFIFEIKQPAYDFGSLLLLTDNQYNRVANRLAITHSEIADTYLTEHLCANKEFDNNEKLVNGVWSLIDNIWRMSFSVDHDTYSDVNEFKFELDGGVWMLKARRYNSDDAVKPDFATIAAAPDIMFDNIPNIVPPRNGFVPVLVLTGDTAYYVDGQGFFDAAGTHPVYGEYYQQQICYTPNWYGWEDRPDTFTNNAGRWLYCKDGVWRLAQGDGIVRTNDLTVKVKTIACAAIPYSPPRKFDIAVVNHAITKVKTGDINLLAGKIAGGLFTPYIYHRLINYSNGINNISRHISVSASSKHSILRQSDMIMVERFSDYNTRQKEISSTRENYTESHSGSGSGSISHSQNETLLNGDRIIASLQGYINAHSGGGITHSSSTSGVQSRYVDGTVTEYFRQVRNTTENTTNNCDGGIYVSLFYGSGPRIDGKKDVCTMTSIAGQTNGVSGGQRILSDDIWQVDYNDGIYKHDDAHSTSTSEDYQVATGFGFNLQNYGTAPCGVGGITSARFTHKKSSANLTITVNYVDADNNPKPGNGTTHWVVSHERRKHTCGGSVVFKTGWTKIEKDGAVTSEFYDDDGSGAESALASISSAYQEPKDSWDVGGSTISYIVYDDEDMCEFS